jgi:hypothetical protein
MAKMKLPPILEGIRSQVGHTVRIAVTALDRPGGVAAKEMVVTI